MSWKISTNSIFAGSNARPAGSANFAPGGTPSSRRFPAWTFTGADGVDHEITIGDPWPSVDTPVNLRERGHDPCRVGRPAGRARALARRRGLRHLTPGHQEGLNPFHHDFKITNQRPAAKRSSIEAEVVPKGMFGSHVARAAARPRHAGRAAPSGPRPRNRPQDAGPGGRATQGSRDPFPPPRSGRCRLPRAGPVLADQHRDRQGALHLRRCRWGSPPRPRSGRLRGSRASRARWSSPASGTFRPPAGDFEPLPEDALHATEHARAVIAAGLDALKTQYPPVGNILLTGSRPYRSRLALAGGRNPAQGAAHVLQRAPPDGRIRGLHLQPVVRPGLRLGRGGRSRGLRSDQGTRGRRPLGCRRRHVARTGQPGHRRRSLCPPPLLRAALFEEHFGIRNNTAWLPDVFGFSGGIPQILIDGRNQPVLHDQGQLERGQSIPVTTSTGGRGSTAAVCSPTTSTIRARATTATSRRSTRSGPGRTSRASAFTTKPCSRSAGAMAGAVHRTRCSQNYARIKDYPVLPRLRNGQGRGLLRQPADRKCPDLSLASSTSNCTGRR